MNGGKRPINLERPCAPAWYQLMSTTSHAVSATPSAPPAVSARRAFAAAEEVIAGAAMAAMLVLLLVETLGRPWFGFAIPGSLQIVRQLTLWVALLGAALSARDDRLLAL